MSGLSDSGWLIAVGVMCLPCLLLAACFVFLLAGQPSAVGFQLGWPVDLQRRLPLLCPFTAELLATGPEAARALVGHQSLGYVVSVELDLGLGL